MCSSSASATSFYVLQTARLVHTHEYIDKFFNGTTSADEQRRTGFKWNPGLLRRCRLETGTCTVPLL